MKKGNNIMLTKKIATLAIVGIMLVATTGLTAFAAEAPETATNFEKPTPSISFDKQAKAEDLQEKRDTMAEKAEEFEQKGAEFESAKATAESKLTASGKTQQEIDEVLGKLSDKFEELKKEVGLQIQEKQAIREANIATREEKGVTKTDDLI